ncbi:hypothetical protein Dsin_021607 [Dipteronia sinensis]|uniref:Calmodulin-binding protein n=1 Tax=Dipteronia sinensis TaxID=43782 RepID=A0AAE0E0E0_9ROSI|nr:hypothetical protein Dsin_021607 [Dipteronia sinensis]
MTTNSGKEIESVIRRAVKREMQRGTEGGTERVVERVMKRLIPTLSTPADSNVNPRTSLDHQIKKSEQVEFQLQFANKLPDTIYTKDKIRDASDESVQIKLIDTISRKTINVGLYSSLEIEIVVLDGDFGYEGNENWTEQEFNAKIVCQREGKGQLVKGKLKLMLTDGVGTIQDLSFSDNSSWIKCKKFRLGARVLQRTSYMGQVRIKGAITEAFTVKDHRSKMNKKHDLPSLDDEVWHLKKITRQGKFHTRLIDNNIHRIRDFKQMYKTNPDQLKLILKDCTESDWEMIVNNASCVVDDHEKLNAYSNPLISPTTGHLLRPFQSPHQGSRGMLNNDSNRASSSSHVNDSKLLLVNSPDCKPNMAVNMKSQYGLLTAILNLDCQLRQFVWLDEYPPSLAAVFMGDCPPLL